MKPNARHVVTRLFLLIVACLMMSSRAGAQVAAPPNAPADVAWDPAKGSLQLSYNGGVVFDGNVEVKDANGERPVAANEVTLKPNVVSGDKVEQTLHWELANPQAGEELVLAGTTTASAEAFPAETLSDAQTRFPMIRNSVGLSDNLRNNALYDRHWDWELVGPADGQTRIVPKTDTDTGRTFAWESHGPAIELVFRPHFYQKFKNIRYFQPWTYSVRKDSITGWCSWWAYKNTFTEGNLKDVLPVLADQHLRDFGYRWVQIDDTFEGGSGTPQSWLNWNKKFPSGMQGYVDAVRAAGFDPGVWMQVYFKDKPTIAAHPEWFVRQAGKPPLKGKWVFYATDTTIPEAANALIRPLFGGFHQPGFSYVKIDTLRHYLYDALHHVPDYGKDRGLTGDEIFRSYLTTARQELGADTYILGCWGVLPEAVGIINGCRLGGDGFGPATLQQYNSWNGVVWRNDPDHCDLRPVTKGTGNGDITKTIGVQSAPADAVIRPTIASMAGAMLMISDKVDVYRDPANLEGAKRASPVLFTVPGQLYDYEPDKTDNLVKVDRSVVMTGAGPSPIDARQQGNVCPWWSLEINEPFEHWTVLARMNWGDTAMGEQTVKFADLGLPADREYLVYEFWSKKYSGVRKDDFVSEALDPKGVQIFAIREKLDRPQIVSTSRHISQGGVDLKDVAWTEKPDTLSGKSEVVINDPYELVVRMPQPFALASATINGHAVQPVVEGELLRLKYGPSATGEISWQLNFTRN